MGRATRVGKSLTSRARQAAHVRRRVRARGGGRFAGGAAEKTRGPLDSASVKGLDSQPLILSLIVAACALGLVLLFAVPAARAMSGRHFPGKDLLDGLFLLPLVLPPVVTGFVLLVLLGKRGPIGSVLRKLEWDMIFTPAAAVLAATVVAFPLMYGSMKAAFAGLDPRLEDAASCLGATPLQGLLDGDVAAGVARIGGRNAAVVRAGAGRIRRDHHDRGEYPGAHHDGAYCDLLRGGGRGLVTGRCVCGGHRVCESGSGGGGELAGTEADGKPSVMVTGPRDLTTEDTEDTEGKFMKRRSVLRVGLVVAGLLAVSPGTSRADEKPSLTVSAAASMKNALAEINARYGAASVNVNFGASGALQRQIEQGAPVDVFLSAAAKNMDELVAAKLMEQATRRNVAANRLVLVVAKTDTKIDSFTDLNKPGVKRFAMGAPESVPAANTRRKCSRTSGSTGPCCRRPCCARTCVRC